MPLIVGGICKTTQDIIDTIEQLLADRDILSNDYYWFEYKRLRAEFYKTKEWIIISGEMIREHPYCTNNPTHAEDLEVDHIQRLQLYPHLALDKTNLQVLCNYCHKKKHETLS